jgi:hypothetical protein
LRFSERTEVIEIARSLAAGPFERLLSYPGVPTSE